MVEGMCRVILIFFGMIVVLVVKMKLVLILLCVM